MKLAALYNEIEPYPAAWMRNLIAAGHIAPGTVDERSIVELDPRDIDGFSQCHFFAGVGVWSYALRLAGWDDARSVWTGSCPCQPFSVAGKQRGADDPRHLWPAWFRLIRECRPAVIFGEQVDGEAGRAWLDAVCSDLEGCGYAVGPAVFPAAGVGAPHRRHRLYFVAYADHAGQRSGQGRVRESQERDDARRCGADGALADTDGGLASDGELQRGGELGLVTPDRGARIVGHSRGARLAIRARDAGDDAEAPGSISGEAAIETGARRIVGDSEGNRRSGRPNDGDEGRRERPPGQAGASFWSDAEWIYCTDGKARPVEPGTFPLAHGSPARMGRLRAYGNAINAQQAAAFVSAAMEVL